MCHKIPTSKFTNLHLTFKNALEAIVSIVAITCRLHPMGIASVKTPTGKGELETRDQADPRVSQLEQQLEEEKMTRNYLQLEKVKRAYSLLTTVQ